MANLELTVVCRVVVLGAGQALSQKVGHHVLCGALVQTPSCGQDIDHVELLEQHGAWLVDGTDDGSALLCEKL